MNIIYRMFIHDFLYFAADQLIKKYNPCQVQRSSDGLVECLHDIEICCNSCRGLGTNGCIVTSLGCKVGLCREAKSLYPDIAKKLTQMSEIARHYSIADIRTSRQEVYNFLSEIRWIRRKL